jgi:hypothetical protein
MEDYMKYVVMVMASILLAVISQAIGWGWFTPGSGLQLNQKGVVLNVAVCIIFGLIGLVYDLSKED